MGKHYRRTLENFSTLSDEKLPANIDYHLELCELKANKLQQRYRVQNCSALPGSFIITEEIKRRVCLFGRVG